MWKTLLTSILRVVAPTLVETGVNALDHKINKSNEGTDFSERAQIKRRPRRTVEQMLADEEVNLQRLLSQSTDELTVNQIRNLAQSVTTSTARVRMLRERLANPVKELSNTGETTEPGTVD